MRFPAIKTPYELSSDPSQALPWDQYRAAFLTSEAAINALPSLPLHPARTLALNALWNDPQRHENLLLHLAARLYNIYAEPLVAGIIYRPHERAALLAFNTRSASEATLHAKRAWGLLLTLCKPPEPLEFPYEVPGDKPPKHLPMHGAPFLSATREYKGRNATIRFVCMNTGKDFSKTARLVDLDNVTCPWCHTKQSLTLPPKAARLPKHLNQTHGCWTSTGRWFDTYANTKYEVICMNSNQNLTVTGERFKNNPGYCKHCKDQFGPQAQ